MSKQLTFPYAMNVTKIYPDESSEYLRYGQYEAVMIAEENGFPVNRTKILVPPTHLVTEVKCSDGTKLIFDKPFYCIEECGYGDNRSG